VNIARFLRDIPPFHSLTDETLAAFARQAREVRFRKGEAIVRAGDPGDTMYVVVEGLVRVRVVENDRERQLGWIGTGEVFGEMALLTGEPRLADVVADERTTCVAVDRAPFHALVRQSREVARFLTELAGRRLLEGGHIARVGKYRVLHEIGRGGMGTVFAGWHEQLRRPVALKMLNHELVFDETYGARFVAEATIVAGLRHPNIVQVFDHEEAYATQFIVMELLTGETLGQRMARERQLGEAMVRRVIVQVAEALRHAHERGITHRDVKPDNVMLCDDGGLKLMDFGIAGELAGDEVAGPIGTPLYMSPEQMRGRDIDQRTDIYALGVMAFSLLTGEAPFLDSDLDTLVHQKENAPLPLVTDWRPEVSHVMAAFIERACAPDPADRFASCAEVVEHFGGPGRLLPLGGGLRGHHVTLLYDASAEAAVRDAIDRLSAMLAGDPVVVSVARHDDLKHLA
jgi:hypothetical protein